MKYFSIALTIFKMEGDKVNASTIMSLLYIINSNSREEAVGSVMEFQQTKNALNDGYVICHINVAGLSIQC